MLWMQRRYKRRHTIKVAIYLADIQSVSGCAAWKSVACTADFCPFSQLGHHIASSDTALHGAMLMHLEQCHSDTAGKIVPWCWWNSQNFYWLQRTPLSMARFRNIKNNLSKSFCAHADQFNCNSCGECSLGLHWLYLVLHHEILAKVNFKTLEGLTCSLEGMDKKF